MNSLFFNSSFILAAADNIPDFIKRRIANGTVVDNGDGTYFDVTNNRVMEAADNFITNAANAVADLTSPLSQWLSDFMKNLRVDIATGIWNADVELFSSIQSDLRANLNSARDLAAQSFTGSSGFANGQIYTKVMAASRNVFTPIAAVIFCLVFAWELSQMVTQSNRNGDRPILQVATALIKLCICMFVISHALDIIMYCFNLGQWAVTKMSSSITGRNPTLNLTSYVTAPVAGEDYMLADIFKLIQLWIVLIIGRAAVCIISLLIFLKVMVWFIEFAIFAAPAAIPMSTWLNRDWSQMGMNYLRKGLALAMEGPMMLFIFGLYGALTTALSNALSSGNGDFISQFVLIVGGAVLVYVSLKKVPQITSSIFSAH